VALGGSGGPPSPPPNRHALPSPSPEEVTGLSFATRRAAARPCPLAREIPSSRDPLLRLLPQPLPVLWPSGACCGLAMPCLGGCSSRRLDPAFPLLACAKLAGRARRLLGVHFKILANRQSAQRSRVRKLQYISELERSVTGLQMEVSALSPRVAFLDHQRSLLTVGNSHLRQRIAALAQDKIFKDAHQEALKEEIERLRQLFHHQKIKATGGTDMATAASMQAKQELLMCEGAAMR
uniref:BZIP domain-containing protein n=1 Tax=Aegilops tauschii subsp. strangulata TaxID=200361 RepID=A0A453KCW5_AEGTS